MHANVVQRIPALARFAARPIFLFLAAVWLVGCATVPREEFAEKYPLKAEYAPRWETNEVPYDEAPLKDKIGRNVRDGLVGISNNFVQAGLTWSTIGPWTGYVVQKVGTFAGDVVALVDDNEYTEHVFTGVLSRHLLRFGSTGQNFVNTMSAIHDTTFESEQRTTLDYVGDEPVHVKVYGKPSAVATLLAAAVADAIVRPTGNLVMVFGGRKTAEKIDKAGLDLIQAGMDVPFL